MKIGSDHDSTPLGHASAQPSRAGASTAAARSASPAAPQDRVQLSATATSIGRLDNGADFDAAKVEAIQRAIREGSFQVNPGAIADRLIAEAQALVSPQTH